MRLFLSLNPNIWVGIRAFNTRFPYASGSETLRLPALCAGNTKDKLEILNTKLETILKVQNPNVLNIFRQRRIRLRRRNFNFVRQLANCFGFRYSDFGFNLAISQCKALVEGYTISRWIILQ